MNLSTKNIVAVGMFTAILSVLSILTIPMPSGVPVTLQTFAMALCGYVLGWRLGVASTGIYLLLGTVGVPIFAGLTGGLSILTGHLGGFLFGFFFLTMLCGIEFRNKKWRICLGLAGLVICHILGVLQFSLVMSTSPEEAFLLVSLPYIVKDVISVAGAYLVSVQVRRAISLR